ncbi:MAG: phosphoribosyltransferase family protein [Pseudomonadota bacterium]|nr:phosphoribosyltransferase family protein [Pseudomonadota bacterium]
MTDLPPGELIVTRSDVTIGLDLLASQLQPILLSQPCTLIGVMTGGLYPMMRLVERLEGNFFIDYCHVSRYRGNKEPGAIHWLSKPHLPVSDRVVIVIDDILDEGVTLKAASDLCSDLGAARVYTAVLIEKDVPRKLLEKPDFSGSIIVPNRYVFGCGMDLDNGWRHLDEIYALP